MSTIIPIEKIYQKIYLIRGEKVLPDRDLAVLYGVTTGNLNLSVKRNSRRFPDDFMFQLTSAERGDLILQNAISKTEGRGGRRHLPYAFTQEGVAMLSSVLHSERAVQVNIAIMRAFVNLRRALASNQEILKRIDDLERDYNQRFAKHDQHFNVLFDVIKKLISPDYKPVRKIGF